MNRLPTHPLTRARRHLQPSFLSMSSSRTHATTPPPPSPSTIDTGFKLTLPSLPNPATSDSAYTRILTWYLPAPLYATLRPQLERFGAEAVSEEVHAWIASAEVQAPYVKSRDVWGQKYSVPQLVTSEGWKRLGGWGVRNG